MLAGSATQRKKDFGFVNLYRCYDSKPFNPNPMGVASTDTNDLPKKACPGGIRVNTFFPTLVTFLSPVIARNDLRYSCWNGKDLDTPDHQSHVKYATGTTCPSTHPVQLPQIFIETIWDTGVFDKSLWPTDGSQPFAWSQGDP